MNVALKLNYKNMKRLTEIGKEEKSNNYPSRCNWCAKEIKKGEEMVTTIRGAYRGHLNFNRYHLNCFKTGLKREKIV